MSRITKEEVVDRKYLTDVSLATVLLSGVLSLNDQIIKDHIHQVAAYQEIYNSGSDVPSNEIWYTATSQIEPNDTTAFGANYLPDESEFDETTGKGILKFDGDVTIIGKDAFNSCINLTSIEIPNSTTSIGDNAFLGCDGLVTATIPNSVESIGASAFATVNNIGSASIEIPDSVTSVGEGAFANVSGKITFTKLYSTYTNKINMSMLNLLGASVPFNLVIDASEVPAAYNISMMLMTAKKGDKNKFTYNIYTDNIVIKDQALAMVTENTIVNVYHIDDTPWE